MDNCYVIVSQLNTLCLNIFFRMQTAKAIGTSSKVVMFFKILDLYQIVKSTTHKLDSIIVTPEERLETH